MGRRHGLFQRNLCKRLPVDSCDRTRCEYSLGRAFPDRSVQNLDALIAEGSYSGTLGWAGVKATHTGDYLDCEATGQPLSINGLDFWKLENDVYVENWVFVDMIHLFRQFGVDLFARIPG
jgi:predicted ester cyclase